MVSKPFILGLLLLLQFMQLVLDSERPVHEAALETFFFFFFLMLLQAGNREQ